jgi:hypothetical protein
VPCLWLKPQKTEKGSEEPQKSKLILNMGPSIHSIVREQAGDRVKPNGTILDPDSEAEKTDAADGKRVISGKFEPKR